MNCTDLGLSDFVLEYELDKTITHTGIYYVNIIMEVNKCIGELAGGKKILELDYKKECKIVFSFREEKRNIKNLLENNPSVISHATKRRSRINVLKLKFLVLKYLGETQKPKQEWQQKQSISKENTKTTLITSPPITNFVSTSLHLSMSIEDL